MGICSAIASLHIGAMHAASLPAGSFVGPDVHVMCCAARGRGGADADADTPRTSSDSHVQIPSSAAAVPSRDVQHCRTASTSSSAGDGTAAANGHHPQHPQLSGLPASAAASSHHAFNGGPDHAAASSSTVPAAAQNGATHGTRMNGFYHRRDSVGDSRSIEGRGSAGTGAGGGAAGNAADPAGIDDASAAADVEARRLQDLRQRWDDLLAQVRIIAIYSSPCTSRPGYSATF